MTLENIFTSDQRAGHEIVFLFAADLVDVALYEQDEMIGHEDDGSEFSAKWVAIEPLVQGVGTLGLNAAALMKEQEHMGAHRSMSWLVKSTGIRVGEVEDMLGLAS